MWTKSNQNKLSEMSLRMYYRQRLLFLVRREVEQSIETVEDGNHLKKDNIRQGNVRSRW